MEVLYPNQSLKSCWNGPIRSGLDLQSLNKFRFRRISEGQEPFPFGLAAKPLLAKLGGQYRIHGIAGREAHGKDKRADARDVE